MLKTEDFENGTKKIRIKLREMDEEKLAGVAARSKPAAMQSPNVGTTTTGVGMSEYNSDAIDERQLQSSGSCRKYATKGETENVASLSDAEDEAKPV